jgi:hypothetical protein
MLDFRRHYCNKCGKSLLSAVDLLDGIFDREGNQNPDYQPKNRGFPDVSSVSLLKVKLDCADEDCPVYPTEKSDPQWEAEMLKLVYALRPIVFSSIPFDKLERDFFPKVDSGFRDLIRVIVYVQRYGV